MEFIRTKKALPTRVYHPSGFRRTIKPEPLPEEPPKEIVTHPLIDYWNMLPGLVKHKKVETDVYKESSKLLDKLRTKGFGDFQWDPEWLSQSKINTRFLSTPWTDVAITGTMDIISQMTQPGYYPGPKSYISRFSLCELLYSRRVLKSLFMVARSRAVARTTVKQFYQIAEENLSKEAKDLLDIFSRYHIKMSPKGAQQLVNLYNNLMAENGEWLRHRCSNHLSFAGMAADWLSYLHYLDPGPAMLTEDGWMWKRFIKDMLGG